MTKANFLFKGTFLLALFILIASCNPLEKETLSNSMLVVVELTGLDMEGNISNFAQSDVLTYANTVTADTASVKLRARMLNPDSISGPSQYNNVMVNRYVVTYFRSDGENIQGIDIPDSFEGYLSTLVEIDKVEDVSFVIVREVAKLEPPLINLHEGRGEGVLQMRAKVDFYGHDLTNNTVKATGYLSIFFANYADAPPVDPDDNGGGK